MQFTYRDKTKRASVDRRTNLQNLFQQLFSTKSRVYGVLDPEGQFYDVQTFQKVLPTLRASHFQFVTEDSQIPRRDLLNSLKYSQITDLGNRLHFIDFVYDLEEFQNLLTGDHFTCLYLVDERDPQALDFLLALEPLINNYSAWISFYYSYHNRLSSQIYEANRKVFQVLRGNKKIVQIQLTNDHKMRQMDDLISKLRHAHLQKSTFTIPSALSTNPKGSASPDPRGKRSKSIRRLVEDSHIVYASQPQSQPQPQAQGKMITRVKAKLTQRIEDDPFNQSNESILNNQDQLFQLVVDLEKEQILDLHVSRLVKKLLMEEHFETIRTLQAHLDGQINIQTMCEKLHRIIDLQQNQQRPTSPFQNLKLASKPVQELDLQQVREAVIERQNLNYSSEEYGMATELWKQNDATLISLAKDAFAKSLRGEVNILPLQVYLRSKFSELIQQHFTVAEQQIIEEYKTKRTNGIFATVQGFRYDTNIKDFIHYLRKAIATVSNINQGKPHSQEIHFFTQPIKAPAPQCVLMPQFDIQNEEQKKNIEPSSQIRLFKQEEGTVGHSAQHQYNSHSSQKPQANPQSSGQSNQHSDQNHTNLAEFEQILGNQLHKKKTEKPQIPQHPQFLQAPQQHGQNQPSQTTTSPNKKQHQQKSARDVIFDEEHFMETKLAKRQELEDKIIRFFAVQQENDLENTFKDLLGALNLDEEKQGRAEQLFSNYDNDLYDIVKNYQTFRVVHQAKTELTKLLATQTHQSQDYRKIKMFNLFMNQVRQFTIQRHLQEEERNFLFKMFMDNDIQVLGTLETYLENSDAQDMLENLQMIVSQYSKYTNIRSPELQFQVPSRRQSGPKPQCIHAKEIIQQFRQYFTFEEKKRLEQVAIDVKDNRIEQLYDQFLADSDLNSFISSMKALTNQDPSKKVQQPSFEVVLKKLKSDGKLKIDDFLLQLICQRKNENRIKGIFEFYCATKNQDDLAANIKEIAVLFLRELIENKIQDLEKTKLLSQQKLTNLKEIVMNKSHRAHPKALGAFSLYLESSQNDEKGAMDELIETLQMIS